MAKRTRFAAACGAVLLVFALLFSVFFIVSEADHNCIGEDCPICHQIQTCQKLLGTALRSPFDLWHRGSALLLFSACRPEDAEHLHCIFAGFVEGKTSELNETLITRGLVCPSKAGFLGTRPDPLVFLRPFFSFCVNSEVLSI